MLNGCNPCMISQCKEIPKNFPVTDDMVKKLLKRPLTEELKVFIPHPNFSSTTYPIPRFGKSRYIVHRYKYNTTFFRLENCFSSTVKWQKISRFLSAAVYRFVSYMTPIVNSNPLPFSCSRNRTVKIRFGHQTIPNTIGCSQRCIFVALKATFIR